MNLYVLNDEKIVLEIKALLNIACGLSEYKYSDKYDEIDKELLSSIDDVNDYANNRIEEILESLESDYIIDDSLEKCILDIYDKEPLLKNTLGECIVYNEDLTNEIVSIINKYDELKFILDFKDKGKVLLIY